MYTCMHNISKKYIAIAQSECRKEVFYRSVLTVLRSGRCASTAGTGELIQRTGNRQSVTIKPTI